MPCHGEFCEVDESCGTTAGAEQEAEPEAVPVKRHGVERKNRREGRKNCEIHQNIQKKHT